MRQFLVDAFARGPFRGGPACVIAPAFSQWPDDAWMQGLAMENNQAETAFIRATGEVGRYDLRWFSPTKEEPICGHATLATAHVLFAELGVAADALHFDTLSGELIVRRGENGLEMDFPALPPHEIAPMAELEAILGAKPVALYGGPALVALLESEAAVRSLAPKVKDLDFYAGSVFAERHVMVTAPADPGAPYDAVSRFFPPDMGIDEDPATGSMHCILAPLYQRLIGKPEM
ncbi:MAG: PhzF family phenazine biosynthesis protein, partial [Asticcacaulis sp.]|nr:PhzF family phenazine biosynthesis protein [Asticcacaulis sp.]